MEFYFSPREKQRADEDLELYKRRARWETDRNEQSSRDSFERNLRDERFNAERDIALAKEKANAEIAADKIKAATDLVTVLTANAKATAESEHKFHSSKQEKETELAKLDAELESKQHLIAEVDSIPALKSETAIARAEADAKDIAIDHLKADVARLDEFVKFITGLLPKVEFDKLALNLNADINVTQGKGGDQKKEGEKKQG